MSKSTSPAQETHPSLTRILCVEDEADIRLVLQMTLESVGKFQALLCASGQEALEQAEAFQPQLVILDSMMPGMDGAQTLLALRQKTTLRETPILFLTAKSQRDEIEALKQLGAAAVLTKPFDPMRLSAQVREIWQNIANNRSHA